MGCRLLLHGKNKILSCSLEAWWAHLLSHVSWWLSLITFCEYFVSVSLTFLHIVMWFLFVRYLRPCSKRDMGSLLHDAGRKIYLLSLRVGAAAALPASCDFHANFIRLAKSGGYFILRRRRVAVCLNSSRRFPFRTPRVFFCELAETVAIWNVDSRRDEKKNKKPASAGQKRQCDEAARKIKVTVCLFELNNWADWQPQVKYLSQTLFKLLFLHHHNR